MTYELIPQYDARASFYGKAQIKETKNKNIYDLQLFSYDALVARYIKIGNIKTYFYFGKYSQTTTRHQKEFFKQNGLTEKQIKELFKNGIIEVLNND